MTVGKPPRLARGMPGRPGTRVFALCLGLWLGCTDGATPTGPGAGAAPLQFLPQYSLAGGSSLETLPINRIRALARDSATTEVLGQLLLDSVDPDASGWEVAIDVRMPESDRGVVVLVSIELIHVADGVEHVQWSGVSAPLHIQPGATQTPAQPIDVHPGPLTNLNVQYVRILDESPTVTEGDSLMLEAEAPIDGGATAELFWSSLDPAVATVAAGGRVRTLRDGNARIVAQAGPHADTLAVAVRQRPDDIRLSPDTARATALDVEVVFTAEVLDPRGAVIDGSELDWSAEGAAEHVGDGVFRTIGNGAAVIRAAVAAQPEVSAAAVLLVEQEVTQLDVSEDSLHFDALGGSHRIAATPRDVNGNVVDDVVVAWHTSDASVAVVSDDGVVESVGVGSAIITAESGGASAPVIVTVERLPAAITIEPSATLLEAIGATAALQATVVAADGLPVDAPVSWSSSAPGVATVAVDGVVTAHANGSATITARAGDVEAAAVVTVQQRVVRIALTPAGADVLLGETIALSATAFDAGDNALDGRLSWSTGNPAVATVAENGTVSTVSPGTTVIRAERDGVTAAAAVNVVAPNLMATMLTLPESVDEGAGIIAGLRVSNGGSAASPATTAELAVTDAHAGTELARVTVEVPQVEAGGDVAIEAVIHLPDGAWPATLRVRAEVDADRDVREAVESDNAVSATTVVRLAIRSISITPESLAFGSLGEAAPVTAQPLDGRGGPLARELTWTSSNAEVAAVSDAGLVSAVGNGTATITVTSDSVAATIPVVVEQVPHDVIISGMPTSDLLPGVPVPLAVAVRDARGVAMPHAVVAWRIVSGPATIDGTGAVTPAAVGAVVVEAAAGDVTANVVLDVVAPNLIAGSLTLPPTIAEGAAVVAVLSVSNGGSAASPATTAELTVRDADAGTELARRTVDVPAIEAGGAAIVEVALEVPADAWPPALRVDADVNPGRDVLESDVADNAATATAVVELAVRSVSVAPDALAFGSLGEAEQVTAQPLDSRGESLARELTWTSSDDAVADVSVDGLVTARGNGAATITVTSGDVHAAIPVVVEQVPHDVVISGLATGDVLPGAAVPLAAAVTDALGAAIPHAVIAWRVVSGAASIDIEGVLTPAGAGPVVVEAAAGDVTALAELDVVAPNLYVELVSQPTDAVIAGGTADVVLRIGNSGGAGAAESSLRLSLLDATLGTPLGESLYPVAAVGAGGTVEVNLQVPVPATVPWPPSVVLVVHVDAAESIVEAAEDDNDATSLPVALVFPVHAIVVDPATVSLTAIGDEATLAAAAYDVHGRLLEGQTFAWAAGDDGVVDVTGEGVVTASVAGATSVTVSADGQSTEVPVTVSQLPASVEIPGAPTSVIAGADAELTAVARDRNGHVIPDAAFLWSSDAAEVATVTAAGALTAVAPGAATVQATLGDLTSSFDITVVPGAPAQILVESGDAQVGTVGQPLADVLTVMVRDAGGFPVPDATLLWETETAADGTLSTGTTTSDAAGRAAVAWTLGRQAGPQHVVVAFSGGEPVRLNAQARAGRAARAVTRGGDGQEIVVALVAPDELQAAVVDEFENPVAGATVRWLLPDGPGHAVSSSETVTDEAGLATVTYTMGHQAGPHQVTAEVIDADGVTVLADARFNLHAKAGRAARAVTRGGDGQEIVVALVAPDELQAAVVDEFENPVAGATVRWLLPDGPGHAVSSSETVTDEAGLATVTYTMGHQAGPHQVTAQVIDADGITVLANTQFNLNAKHGPLARLNLRGRDFRGERLVTPQDTLELLALEDTVDFTVAPQDEFGNPIVGVTFSWMSTEETIVAADVVAPGQARGSSRTNGTSQIRVEGSLDGFLLVDSAYVTVEQEAVGSIAVPDEASVVVGMTVSLSADGFDILGKEIKQFRWSIVDATGDLIGGAEIVGSSNTQTVEIRGLSAGEVTILVSDPRRSTTKQFTLQVVPPT